MIARKGCAPWVMAYTMDAMDASRRHRGDWWEMECNLGIVEAMARTMGIGKRGDPRRYLDTPGVAFFLCLWYLGSLCVPAVHLM